MKSFPRKSRVFMTGVLLIFVLVHAGEAMEEAWKFIASDKESNYYNNVKRKDHLEKGHFRIEVKAVCIDKQKFLGSVKKLGRPAKKYEKYSHTIFVAIVDCPNKRCLIELITEYDSQGKVIDYVAGALTNWLPVSKGTLGEILYQAACY